MAYLVQPDYVKYFCTCGQLKPITALYFCRHCLKIRCGFCICHEVDSHYCSHCLENMPSSEARLKKNRCSSCFNCPSCFHVLSTRATMVQQSKQAADPAGGDTKVENKQPKKNYYLACFNCRWTSRDVGIPDQTIASGGWPERANPHTNRVNQLLDYYKAIAQQEKQEKMEKKYTLRGKYFTLTDKTGLTGAMARNLAGLPSTESSAANAIAAFTPSQATDEVPPLSDDYYTKEVDLKQITSMPQRLASPEWDPVVVSRLYPIPRPLTVKRSQRCRECDHNLTKPEYNPGSVKFKIELLAYHHVPEVKIISVEPMKVGAESNVLLKLSNPTAFEMTVEAAPEADVAEELDREVEKLTISKNPSIPSGATCTIGGCGPLHLSQRDDAAEYDDPQPHAAHPNIVWRKANKMAVRLPVRDVTGNPGERVMATLELQYSYTNTVPPSAAQPRQPRDHTLRTKLILDLGLL